MRLFLSHLLCLAFTAIITTSAAASNSSSSKSSGKTLTGYFPNWLYARWPVSNIDFSKYTHINYAFAIMIKGSTPEWTDPQQVETQLPELVKAAHAKDAKVLISVGGWSGCLTFSSMVGDSSKRSEFIKWSTDQIDKYDIDGIDIDWEYPGRQGAGCNEVDKANDAKNLLTLLQELRSAMDKKYKNKELTAAVHVRTFDTSSGNMKDVSAFGKVLDRVNIMAYDINGAFNSTSGPNAPFNFEPGLGYDDSYVSSIETWIKAGVPASKISPGLAFYGRSTTSTVDMSKTNQYQPQVKGKPPKGDSLDAYWQDPNCPKDPGGMSGIWRYGNLRSEGVLTAPDKAASPWIRQWDKVTQTPWLFNPKDKTFISYDDPKSISIKVDYALCKDLGGVMVFSVDEDSSNNELLNEAYKIRTGSNSSSKNCNSN
ncbi:glycoside hydrolase family 18 protein [Lichtheimia corymbifera JMRC:FSU:9682]|uniref:Glycoside hydrolase family 18 protein n=1 Tax=Lichtheimia corymbifera JMRC:FSU:9682 TaxID=1263082 RepID=A0A068RX00_9FUNG|nr:glycoside hydrolase family 18 protein [Lichtheimia corymbifera JMRC:FSU:9682]